MSSDKLDAARRDAVGDRYRLSRIADIVLDRQVDLAAIHATLGVDCRSRGLACLN